MNKIHFQDIQAQHLNRYRLVKVDGTADEYDLIPVRGTVTQEGTPIRALELNQLQDNVDAALAEKLPQLPNNATVSAGGDNNNYISTHSYATYTNSLYPVSGGNMSVGGSLLPTSGTTKNIGSSNSRWENVYANNIYQAGVRPWDTFSLPYEHGNFTPTFTFELDSEEVKGTGGAYGQYVRIGKLVFCNFLIYVSGAFPAGSTGGNNYVYISGFPFPASANLTNAPIPYYTGANANHYPYLYGSITANAQKMSLRASGGSNEIINFRRSMLAGQTDVRLSGFICYSTDY